MSLRPKGRSQRDRTSMTPSDLRGGRWEGGQLCALLSHTSGLCEFGSLVHKEEILLPEDEASAIGLEVAAAVWAHWALCEERPAGKESSQG